MEPEFKAWSNRTEVAAAMSLGAVVSAYTFNSDAPSTDAGLREITVERCQQIDNSVLWAVRWHGRCVSRSGVIEIEPIPSSRTEEWIDRYRFPKLHDALQQAALLAPAVMAWRINQEPPPSVVPRAPMAGGHSDE